jgi:rare lipoprotein A
MTRPLRLPLAGESPLARCARQFWGAAGERLRDLRLRRVPSGLGAARRPDCLVGVLVALVAVLLSACGTQSYRPVEDRTSPRPSPPAPTVVKPVPAKPAYVLKQGGAYYQDDGPGDNPPPNLEAIADAVPRDEPLHRFANNPYSVFGRDYVPLRARAAYRASGVASWYGRKFHGQRTSSGEPYDMYAMTAAHPTLPIPSYARVSNPANGRSVLVRVNDRGPFHAGRIMDLSFAAAWKLGYVDRGSTPVDVESVLPGQVLPPVPAPDDDPIARFATALEPSGPATLPVTSDGQGIFLQLGAFGNADNAEALRAHLAQVLGTLGERLRVRADRGWYRVQLGPWADRDEARRVAEQLAERLEMRPLLVKN